MRWVPGARGDTSGYTPCPDPVWQSTATPPLPLPLPQSAFPVMTKATGAHRKQQQPHSTSALSQQRAAVNLHAAGIDVGAEAPFVAVPPVTIPSRCAALARIQST
jgi:hypothetical protein